MFAGNATAELQAKIDHSVDRLADRIWRRALLMMVSTLLLIVGLGLALTALGLLIEPHVGSAAAFAVIGVIVLAASGGLFLYMQRHR